MFFISLVLPNGLESTIKTNKAEGQNKFTPVRYHKKKRMDGSSQFYTSIKSRDSKEANKDPRRERERVADRIRTCATNRIDKQET